MWGGRVGGGVVPVCACMCALVFSGVLCPQKQGLLRRGAQYGHLNFHTAHVLCMCLWCVTFYLQYD